MRCPGPAPLEPWNNPTLPGQRTGRILSTPRNPTQFKTHPVKNPYSYARGVTNTRVTNADDDATLQDLRSQFKKPVVVPHAAVQYHNMSKKERGDVKKSLPYFVGGVVDGKRHDSNVQARTLLTLDIEAKDGQAVPPPPQDVFDNLEALGREGWVYTSISHKRHEGPPIPGGAAPGRAPGGRRAHGGCAAGEHPGRGRDA